ncbi:unnamed protein product [Porites lobata]|uniref:receptor protein-tyrosine kinase n=1 Tax=Porites lobata TaxID=104759 RepID=A0ABN8NSJ9_9CNID|nr:unnamed protein product [Porites lobata]
MKATFYDVLLLAVCIYCGSSQNLKRCYDSCSSKIPDFQQCNETCDQLATLAKSNVTLVPPTPTPPLLLSSEYFEFTLQWTEYSQRYNDSPVIFVLEVKRHENISDPASFLPVIKKYHTTNFTTFKIPQDFVIKTNFSFRLAAIALQGTSNFSSPSPLYTTNSTCKTGQDIFGNPTPCPVFNVRVIFNVTEVPFRAPRVAAILSWDYPPDAYVRLKETGLSIRVLLSSYVDNIPAELRNACHKDGNLLDFTTDLIDVSTPRSSETYVLSPEDKLYYGCPYEVKISTTFAENFETPATFYVPHCIGGFCGCDAGQQNTPKIVSEHVDFDIRKNNQSVNLTTVNATWSIEAWGKTRPAFFRLVMQECPGDVCPALQGYQLEDHLADPATTVHSFVFPNLTEGEWHHFIIFAFDKSGCLLLPVEGERFQALVPVPTARVTSTAKPSTTPSPATHPPPDTHLPPVSSTAEASISSGTVAAITVPIVLFMLAGLALVLLFFHRRQRKADRLHRAPTGLQRLADHMQHGDQNNFSRNRHSDLSSPYSSEYDRFDLVVNLPSKSEGGLEVNPAYVEQRIQEAMETGEADEYEVGYHRLELKRVLGKGAFGKVFLAEAYGLGESQDTTTLVAVKVLNEKANEDEEEDFKMEINFMKTIGRHENVVTMLGCCTLYPPLCLVVEYVPHGDLLHYLRNLRKTFEMQNRKLQGEDIDKLKKENQSTSSKTQAGAQSVTGGGNDSGSPLVHAANDVKRYEKFFEPGELSRLKRTNSASTNSGSSTLSALTAPRRASEIPQVHYVARVPNDASNNTETTLVSDTKSAAKEEVSSPTRKMGLDGALDSDDLQSFALQIANGMAYLAGRGVIHRDLAARNILVGDEKVLKISDFGLSREGIYVKRSTGKIPLRWLSIEAMRDRIYSTHSDVWAFGIVLWEICTLGGFPYPTLNDRDLLDYLLDGKRMEKPDNCTDEIYQIMLACWASDCEDRPSFQTLSEQLFDMQKEEHPYVNVDPSQDFILPPTAGQDTVGNLIAFSDGTFSGETADQELAKPEALPSQMVGNFVIQCNLVPRKDSGIPESVKFLLVECRDPEIFLVESGILGFGIRNTFQGNRNPSSTDEESGIQYLDCRIQHLTSGIHSVDSRIQDCLGFPYMRRRIE